MKVFMTLLIVFSACFAAEMIPMSDVRNIADQFVRQRYDDYVFQDMLMYYGTDDIPSAYAFIYSNEAGEHVTVIMGARITCTPVFEFYKGVPNYYTTLERAKTEAHKSTSATPVFKKIYYCGPEIEYYLFECGGREVLLNTYSVQQLDKSALFDYIPETDQKVERILRSKWNTYLAADDLGPSRDAYVPGVPFVVWSYGCSPTASSMIYWYWDMNGYSRLVDYFFDRHDDAENNDDYNRPNVQRELAVAMLTDSMNGGTSFSDIANGHIIVALNNGYTFSSTLSPMGGTWNNFLFDWLEAELDAGRPTHWGFIDYFYAGQYINHSTCAVGYEISPPDTFVIVHNTWNDQEENFNLWTYQGGIWSKPRVITVVPSGADNNTIDVTWPSDVNTWMFQGLTYKLTWDATGSNIDHLKMWLAPGVLHESYDSTNWALVDDNIPNTGSYLYTTPAGSLHHRVNIAGLNASNARVSADGSFASFDTRPVIASNMDLYGHNLLGQRNAQDVVAVGDYAYVTLGPYGIGVVDISTPTIPELVNTVSIGGEPRSLAYDGSYLYCTTYSDSGFVVISLSSPTNPSVVGSTKLGNLTMGLDVHGSYAYVATFMAGLSVVSISSPSAPSLAGSYDTPGQTYDVCIEHDTVAYLADGSQDLRWLNVANPSSITEIGQMSTPGIVKGLWWDGLLFVGSGPGGVGIVDISDPEVPDSLSWYDTGGQPYTGYRDGWKLYVADGPDGIRVLDIGDGTNPTEIGYLDSYGSANAIAMSNGVIIMADGDDGIYVMAFTGIEENQAQNAFNVRFSTFPNPFKSNMTMQLASSIQEHVKIVVYDVLGTKVRNITDQVVAPGRYDYTWDATNDAGQPVAAGIYLIEVTAGNTTQTQKVIFVQ
jgi:hypothetical protein